MRQLLFAAMAASSCAWGQLPPGYRVVEVTNNPYWEAQCRINNSGQVVFMGRMGTTRQSQEIFLYDIPTRQLTRLTNDNIQDAGPDINDAGMIVWSRGLGPTDPSSGEPSLEIVVYREGQLTQLTTNAQYDIQPSINSLGQIAWSRYGSILCGGHVQDIWMYDGETILQITSDAESDFVENQSAIINDLGDIVWTRYDFCDPPPGLYFASDIMLYSEGSFQRVTFDPESQPQVPHLNNEREVTFDYVDVALERDVVAIWRDGQLEVLGEGCCGVSENGVTAFSAWNGQAAQSDLWVRRGGIVYQITNDSSTDSFCDVSTAGSVVWKTGDFPAGNIRLLLRFDPGDLNCDGSINPFDIEPFITALSNPAQYQGTYPNCDPLLADLTDDGSVNGFDIQPFVELLSP